MNRISVQRSQKLTVKISLTDSHSKTSIPSLRGDYKTIDLLTQDIAMWIKARAAVQRVDRADSADRADVVFTHSLHRPLCL